MKKTYLIIIGAFLICATLIALITANLVLINNKTSCTNNESDLINTITPTPSSNELNIPTAPPDATQSIDFLDSNGNLNFSIISNADRSTALEVIYFVLENKKYNSMGYTEERYDDDTTTVINFKQEVHGQHDSPTALLIGLTTTKISRIGELHNTTTTSASYLDEISPYNAFGYEVVSKYTSEETNDKNYSLSIVPSIGGIRITSYKFESGSISLNNYYLLSIDIGENGYVYAMKYQTLAQGWEISEINYNEQYNLPVPSELPLTP